jgi:amidohydrolase
MLTPQDIADLTRWRHDLHRHPEVSRHESQTAARVVAALAPSAPTQILQGLGGHGVAAIWGDAGPTILFRAELDALPITEISQIPHRSAIPGTGHLCGHDGHMAILLGLARLIHRRPPRARVILLFQPAEEDGSGAAAIMADPRYAQIRPDYAFALHNLPGVPFGEVRLKEGPVNCASQGLKITLTGKTAHASLPETGLSPAAALANLLPALTALGAQGPLDADYRLVTITHANLGAPAFGIAPGEAEIWATLRTLTDAPMAALRAKAEALARAEATRHGLTVTFETHDDFAASVNHPEATQHLAKALTTLTIPQTAQDLPMRASEDFGRLGTAPTRSAMLFLGAGESHPALHNPDYDFPDALIPIGAKIFHRVLQDLAS